MGTFMGHILPGSFFLAFAIYWSIRVFDRLFRSKGLARYSNTATFPCAACCGKKKTCNQEAILKLVAVTIGLTGEIVTAFENGKFVHMGNAQHATMFFAFGLSSVIDLLVHHKAAFVVPGMDYAAAFLALVIEGLLFAYHLHGLSMLETQLHVLLFYIISGNAVAVLAELHFSKSPLAACARCYFFLLQGTWFWQVAFILYNPLPGHVWDGSDHENLMISTMYFAWHVLGDLLGMLFIAILVFYFGRSRRAAATYISLQGRTDDRITDNGSAECHGQDSDDCTSHA